MVKGGFMGSCKPEVSPTSISLKYESDGSVRVILGCGVSTVFSGVDWERNFEYEGSHGWTHEALLDIALDEIFDALCMACGKWESCHFGRSDVDGGSVE